MKKLLHLFLLFNAYNVTIQSSEKNNLTDQRKKELDFIISTGLEPWRADCNDMTNRLEKRFDESTEKMNSEHEKVMTALKSLEEQQERYAEEIKAALDNFEERFHQRTEKIRADFKK